MGPRRELFIGAVLALIGAVLVAQAAGAPAPTGVDAYRRVDDLAYRSVRVGRGRSGSYAHLDDADGRRYLFPDYHWPEGMGRAEIGRALRADSVATVWLREGSGYAVIKGIRTRLLWADPADAVPIDRRRRRTALMLAPALLLTGLLLVAHAAHRTRARPPAAAR